MKKILIEQFEKPPLHSNNTTIVNILLFSFKQTNSFPFTFPFSVLLYINKNKKKTIIK